MKSRMIRNAEYIPEQEKARYSDLQVLSSSAGYYIGTLYTSEEGFVEPGSRDSFGYFKSKSQAEKILEAIENTPETYCEYLKDTME